MRIHFVLAAVLVALAGCVIADRRDSDLERQAGNLEERTDRFYDELRRGPADSETLDDARELAEAADDFERAIADGESRDDLRDEFEVLSARYHSLREEYDEDRPDGDERDHFEEITTAYLEIEGNLKY